MTIRKYSLCTALLAAAVATGILALLPASETIEAQTGARSCKDARERLESNRRQVARYEADIAIKNNPKPWTDWLAGLDRAVKAGYVVGYVNDICRALMCNASPPAADQDSRLAFQMDVRDELYRTINDVAKTDMKTLNEYLASARQFVINADADLRKAGCGNIEVISATYGGNCKAPQDNVTSYLAKACNGHEWCDYRIDYREMGGDPVDGCAKDYVAKWKCGDLPKIYTLVVEPEAGRGSTALLYCDK